MEVKGNIPSEFYLLPYEDHSIDITARKRKREDEYLSTVPPGYRFNPDDDVLIRDYLKPKVFNEPMPQNQMIDVNIYLYSPEILAETYKQYGGETEMYFFTPRDRKYPNGSRSYRAAGDGFWRLSAAEKKVKDSTNTVIGFKKTLVFYKGKFPKGDSTNWLMHEYRIINPPIDQNDMKLDDWTLCRIYNLRAEDAPRVAVAGGADVRLAPGHDKWRIQNFMFRG